ncbi:uncharacterized protein NPIL_317541 [Nephila pilipes]|uniref:Uncharacterized protein n=1 Tax=Nephila pilipes TaxID=299642 RepID=A0A8X6IW24_NEPPI|nr:uncharacterized protein NPIL_317541 [Nephila pilipes]
MTPDLKLEIFASQLCQVLWCNKKFLSQYSGLSSLYPNECHLVSQDEIFQESYLKAVSMRYQLFHAVFHKEISENVPGFEFSSSRISNYISFTCDRDDLFVNLTVFERIFATCAFVVQLGFFCYEIQGYKDIIRYAHLCWAMYFDKYSEQFYCLGGWSQLMITSASYVLPWEFFSCKIMVLQHIYFRLFEVMKAIEDYETFKSRSSFDCKTLSKTWIKFHQQNLYKLDNFDGVVDAKKKQDITDSKSVEKLLAHLKRLCDPCGSITYQVFTSIKKSCSENSKVPHPVKNTRNILISKNPHPQVVSTNEYTRSHDENLTFHSKVSQPPSLESSENDRDEKELLVYLRDSVIQQHITVFDTYESEPKCPRKCLHAQPSSYLEQDFSHNNANSGGSLLEITGPNSSQSILNMEHHRVNLPKFGTGEKVVSMAENLQNIDSVEQSVPYLTKDSETCKQSSEIVFQTLLKADNLTLNDATTHVASDIEIKERKIEVNDDESIWQDLSRNTNTNEIDLSRNTLILMKHKSSNDGFTKNKTHSDSDQKANEGTNKEADFERENPEVKCLLRMFLALGNRQGIVFGLSLLQCSDKRHYKKISKRK